MRAGDAHVIELAAVAGHGRYAVLFRLGGDVCEMRALSEEDLVYRASRAQSLEDGVAALDPPAEGGGGSFHMPYFHTLHV